MFDLEETIRERHSTRLFLPKPVPRELVYQALALAVCAPSNSNIQPWHMVFASGPVAKSPAPRRRGLSIFAICRSRRMSGNGSRRANSQCSA
jgi:hypothetical protein